MAETTHSRVAIIGSGAAGYTAAIYAARAMLEPVVFAGIQPGGQLTITSEVENYPGFAEQIQGPWLMEQMREQALAMGARIIEDTITEAHLGKRPFLLAGDSGRAYSADAVIIATGAQAMWLGPVSPPRSRSQRETATLRVLRSIGGSSLAEVAASIFSAAERSSSEPATRRTLLGGSFSMTRIHCSGG